MGIKLVDGMSEKKLRKVKIAIVIEGEQNPINKSLVVEVHADLLNQDCIDILFERDIRPALSQLISSIENGNG